jgi:uncharacterized protein (DUF433 family)
MNATNVIEHVPIHTDTDGVVRVAGTRVTLDTVVGAFDAGATAEEIAQQYSSVPLVDIYSVITYYLRHRAEVDVYLCGRAAQAERVREDVERRFPSAGLRERLLARRQ